MNLCQCRHLSREEFEETFVEIYAQREERILVTTIEVLSPSNKRPNTEGWEEYDATARRCCLAGRTTSRSTCSAVVISFRC